MVLYFAEKNLLRDLQILLLSDSIKKIACGIKKKKYRFAYKRLLNFDSLRFNKKLRVE